MTFTALSRHSINIQVEKGRDPGLFEYFTVKRENWDLACKFAIHGALDDCTDGHARYGTNEYRIGAEFYSGAAMPRTYFVATLQQDRKPVKDIQLYISLTNIT